MNYGDHNFMEIIQQTKLRVEPVELDFVERVERVELCCSTMLSSRAKWNLAFTPGFHCQSPGLW